MRALLLTTCPHWPWARQIPESGLPAGVIVDVDRIEPGTTYDLVIVFEDTVRDGQCIPCRACHFIPGEPQGIVPRYHPSFLRQFDAVHGFRNDLVHPQLRPSHSWLPWFYGVDHNRSFTPVHTHASLVAAARPAKDRLVSVVCSNKTHTEGHRRRLAFIDRLKARLGDRLDIFGAGLRAIADKSEAIDRYRYHLVLENSIHPGYVSEKLWDAFLGWSCPIYAGAPDAPGILDWPSLPVIDLSDLDRAVESTTTLIASDAWSVHTATLSRVRSDVLGRHNLFHHIAHIAAGVPQSAARMLTLRSHAAIRSDWRSFLPRAWAGMRRRLARPEARG